MRTEDRKMDSRLRGNDKRNLDSCLRRNDHRAGVRYKGHDMRTEDRKMDSRLRGNDKGIAGGDADFNRFLDRLEMADGR